MTKQKFGLLSSVGKFGRDERGGILLNFTVMLPAIVAFAGIVLDGSALLHLHSDLQELADASALAGAYELDGNSGARTRATAKARSLLNNNPNWSNVASGTTFQIADPTFYKTLNPPTVATSDGNAFFMKVTTVT